jgi:hypothetical protein
MLLTQEALDLTPAADSLEPPKGNDYPEGGLQAWSVVLGAWCAMVPSMGLLNSLGILHAWTSTHQLSYYSESSIGWIFGAYGFFLYFAGAQAGKYLPFHYNSTYLSRRQGRFSTHLVRIMC